MEKKRILFMRHAKSSRGDSMRDFDRPLNSRGQKDALKLGEYLKGLSICPDQIFCSPAERAKQTALTLKDTLGCNRNRIIWDEELYHGSAKAYLNAVRSAGESSSIVLAIGHNPMIAEVMGALTARNFVHHVSAAAMGCFETDALTWTDVQPQSCKLLWFVTPGEL